MRTDTTQLMTELAALQLAANKRYVEDPLPASDAVARAALQRDIERFDLGRHVVELELHGYTILPPGKAAAPEFADRLRDTIERVSDERVAQGVDSRIPTSKGLGRMLHHILPEDRIFEEAVLNEVTLTLVTYLVGYRARLCSLGAMIKTNEVDAALGWHGDNWDLSAPWAQQPSGCNVSWLLTDYSRENGGTVVIPGSHTWCQRPSQDLRIDDERTTVIEAPAGSVAVWHSNLWHASLPRRAEGKRIALAGIYQRPHLLWHEINFFTTTTEMIDRNPGRFAVLTGLAGASQVPWGAEGPNTDYAAWPREYSRWI